MPLVRSGRPGAPTVVLLHGFLGAAEDWAAITGDLAGDYDCIAPDLPGHGGNLHLPDDSAYTLAGAAGAIVAMLDALSVKSGILIGYSLGGRLALALAAGAPARWRGLVLESAAPGLVGEVERAERVAADEAWAQRLEAESLDAFLRAWYAQPMFAQHPPDAAVLARRRRNDPAELARALRGMGLGRQPPLWDALAKLSMPVLALAGEHDAKFVALAERMQRLCPSATRAIVSAAGHAAHADSPGEFLRHLHGFLNSLE